MSQPPYDPTRPFEQPEYDANQPPPAPFPPQDPFQVPASAPPASPYAPYEPPAASPYPAYQAPDSAPPASPYTPYPNSGPPASPYTPYPDGSPPTAPFPPQPYAAPVSGYPPQSPAAYPPPPGYDKGGYPAPPMYQPMMVGHIGMPTSGWAVASMVLGIIGLVLLPCAFGAFGIPSLLAVIFGHLGLAETKRGAKGGYGMAVAGLVLGYLFIGPAILIAVLGGVGGITGLL